MKSRLKADGSHLDDRLSVLQMRDLLLHMHRCVAGDAALREFSSHLLHAMTSLEEVRAMALNVMLEADAERASQGTQTSLRRLN